MEADKKNKEQLLQQISELQERIRAFEEAELHWKDANQTFIESAKEYRAVVEIATELINRFKPDTTLTFVNEAYCQYYGKTREELLGRSFVPFCVERDHNMILHKLKSLDPKNPVVMHEGPVLVPWSEKERWQRWSNKAIFNDSGEVIEIQSVGRDITEQKQIETALHVSDMALKKHTAELESTNIELREMMEQKSDFILQVTHELRGPLAALKGYLEMILMGITGEIGERTAEALRKAEFRTKNLITIIDEMIDYACMKFKDDIEYDVVELDLKDLIQLNINLPGVIFDGKQISFSIRVPEDMRIRASRDLLNIILNNLLTNAVRYSHVGGNVYVQAAREGLEIRLTVKDEGIGIESDELGKIFEDFYRTKKARMMDREGTGLGLSVIKKAVRLMEGRIEIDSEVGIGTSVHILLPLSES